MDQYGSPYNGGSTYDNPYDLSQTDQPVSEYTIDLSQYETGVYSDQTQYPTYQAGGAYQDSAPSGPSGTGPYQDIGRVPTYGSAPHRPHGTTRRSAPRAPASFARAAVDINTWNQICTTNRDSIVNARLVLGTQPWANGEPLQWPVMRQVVSNLEQLARPYYGGAADASDQNTEEKDFWYGNGARTRPPTQADVNSIMQGIRDVKAWEANCSEILRASFLTGNAGAAWGQQY